MTGVLHAMAASVFSERLIITVGTGLGSGYVSGEFGSISPGTFRGKTVTVARSTSNLDFQIGIDDASVLPQNFFTRITVEDGAGVLRSYTSASATYVPGGVGGENWNWGDGSNRVFTSSDDTEQHRLTFYL